MNKPQIPPSGSSRLAHHMAPKMGVLPRDQTMRALTMHVSADGSRSIRYEANYPRPTPGTAEVLIKVSLAGICGSDLELLQGYKLQAASIVLGHEFVGTLVEFGPGCPSPTDRHIKVHDRVVAEINCVPADCTVARTAYERAQDESRTALGIFGRDGAFAEFVTVPFVNVHVVHKTIPTRVAVFAEPIAAACQILEQGVITPLQRVAVLGAGRLGWVVAKVLAASGNQVEMLTRRPVSSVLPYIRRGPTDDCIIPVVSLMSQDGTEQLANCYDTVIDCTGNPLGMETAIRLVKPRGTIVLKSTHSANHSIPVDLSLVVVKEIRVVGSRCGPFDVALRLLRHNLMDVESLITRIFALEDGEAAFAKATETGVLKVLLQIGPQ